MLQPVFIFALQRSGTNLLRRSLATSSQFVDFDEVFDPRKPGYWSYYRREVEANPQWLAPTGRRIHWFENCLAEWLGNAGEAGGLSVPQPEHPIPNDAAKFGLIDVKYNSAHALNDLGHEPFESPSLIQWLVQKQYPVIHLIRESLLENYVSFLVGSQTQNWVVPKTAAKELREERPTAGTQLILDPTETIFQLQRRQRQIALFRNLLAATNSLELTYESLTSDSGELSQDTIVQVCQLLGCEANLKLAVPTKKTGRPLSKVVVNLESEIAPALHQAGLAEFLPAASRDGQTNSRNSESDGNSPESSLPIRIVAQPPLKYVPRISRKAKGFKLGFVIGDGSQRLAKAIGVWGNARAELPHPFEIVEPFSQHVNGFWNYRGRLLAQLPDLAVPSLQNQIEVWERYLDRQLVAAQAAGQQKRLLFHLNYAQAFHLNEAWYHLTSRPLLLNWMVEQQTPVMHVVSSQSNLNIAGAADEAAQSHSRRRLNKTQLEAFRAWFAPANVWEVELADWCDLERCRSDDALADDSRGDISLLEISRFLGGAPPTLYHASSHQQVAMATGSQN